MKKYKNSEYVTGAIAILFVISIIPSIWGGDYKVMATLFVLIIISMIFGSAFDTREPFHETKEYKHKRESSFQTRLEAMKEKRNQAKTN